VHAVGVEHAGQLDLKLVGTVEGEGMVEAVFVVGGGDDLRDDELAITGGDDGAVTVIGVLVQKTVVFLVNADGVLDDSGITLASSHDGIEVVDGALAITSELQRVGHETGTILTDVESVLLVVRRVGVTVGNDHLDDTDTVEESALAVLMLILHANIRQNNTFTVVKSNVHLVASPRNLISSHAERNALGLGDVDRLQSAINVVLANKLGHVVVRGERNLCSLTVDVADINSEDLLLLSIDHDGEIQRVRILVIVGRSAIVHQTLLETALIAPTLINANCPSIDVDLGHVIDAEILAGLNDTRVGASNALADVKILEGQSRADFRDVLPNLDLAVGDVGDNLGDLTIALFDDDGESATRRPGTSSGAESSIFCL